MAKQIINCEKGHRKKYYQKIAESRFFKGEKELTHSLNVAIAASIGYKRNKFKPLESVEWISRVEYVEKDTKMKTFFQSLAVAREKSLDVLLDDEKVYEIAEAYANGGIIHLFNLFTGAEGSGDFDKEMESQINDVMQ